MLRSSRSKNYSESGLNQLLESYLNTENKFSYSKLNYKSSNGSLKNIRCFNYSNCKQQISVSDSFYEVKVDGLVELDEIYLCLRCGDKHQVTKEFWVKEAFHEQRYSRDDFDKLLDAFKDKENEYAYKLKKHYFKNEYDLKCFNPNCNQKIEHMNKYYQVTKNETKLDPISLCPTCRSHHQEFKDFYEPNVKKCINIKCLGVFRATTETYLHFKSFDTCNLCRYLGITNENNKQPITTAVCIVPECNETFNLIDNSQNDSSPCKLSKCFKNGHLEGYEDIKESNEIKFICESCLKRVYANPKNETRSDGTILYKIPSYNYVETVCRLNISSICQQIKVVHSNFLANDKFNSKKYDDVCSNCLQLVHKYGEQDKIQAKIRNGGLECRNCKCTSSILFIQIDDDQFLCQICMAGEGWFDERNDDKIRFACINIDYAEDTREKEANYQKILKIFENDKFKNAFIYNYLDGNFEINDYETFKRKFIYVGKSKDRILSSKNKSGWKNSYLRHLDFKNYQLVSKLKLNNIKNVLSQKEYTGKVAIFKSFNALSVNSAFFHEQYQIDYILNNLDDFPLSSNIQIGKNVVVFRDDKIKHQMSEFIFEKVYEEYKIQKELNKIELYSLEDINNLGK